MDGPYVVGLDLSLTATGLAEFRLDSGLLLVETFGTKGHKGDTFAQRGARLTKMADFILDWTCTPGMDPTLVVVEGPSYGSVFGSQHDRSGLWWLVVSVLMDEGIDVLVVSPRSRAKYATGSGNAKKDVVLAHVIERYADMTDECRIANDNEADAVTLAAMGARYLGFPIEEELPAENLSAMDGVEALCLPVA